MLFNAILLNRSCTSISSMILSMCTEVQNNHYKFCIRSSQYMSMENEQAPMCSHTGHENNIVPIQLPGDEHLYSLAEFFSVMGDSTRIKILYVLFESEMCVCDIAKTTNMSLSAISHQLKILKQAHLVRYRKEGKSVIYSLDDEHVRTIIDMGNEHLFET